MPSQTLPKRLHNFLLWEGDLRLVNRSIPGITPLLVGIIKFNWIMQCSESINGRGSKRERRHYRNGRCQAGFGLSHWPPVARQTPFTIKHYGFKPESVRSVTGPSVSHHVPSAGEKSIYLFNWPLAQISNQPITWQKLCAFRHLEVVKAICWSSNRAEWKRGI